MHKKREQKRTEDCLLAEVSLDVCDGIDIGSNYDFHIIYGLLKKQNSE